MQLSLQLLNGLSHYCWTQMVDLSLIRQDLAAEMQLCRVNIWEEAGK